MGAYQVVFSDYASRDLEQIVNYIPRDNPHAAQHFEEKLVSRALDLSDAYVAKTGADFRDAQKCASWSRVTT